MAKGPRLPGESPVVDGNAKGGGDGLSELEQALQKTGKADIYSIYFTFNSDAIREESEPTLKMVGALMRKHPDWKLTINGHTDNIASDKYNLELSRRRSAAGGQSPHDALRRRAGAPGLRRFGRGGAHRNE